MWSYYNSQVPVSELTGVLLQQGTQCRELLESEGRTHCCPSLPISAYPGFLIKCQSHIFRSVDYIKYSKFLQKLTFNLVYNSQKFPNKISYLDLFFTFSLGTLIKLFLLAEKWAPSSFNYGSFKREWNCFFAFSREIFPLIW